MVSSECGKGMQLMRCRPSRRLSSSQEPVPPRPWLEYRGVQKKHNRRRRRRLFSTNCPSCSTTYCARNKTGYHRRTEDSLVGRRTGNDEYCPWRPGRRRRAVVLVVAGFVALGIFLLSYAGHPPYSGLGIGILRLSVGAGVAFIWYGVRILHASRTTSAEEMRRIAGSGVDRRELRARGADRFAAGHATACSQRPGGRGRNRNRRRQANRG